MSFRDSDHIHVLPTDPSMTEQVVWFRDIAESVPTCALGNLFTERFVDWVCEMVNASGDGCPDIMAKLEQALQREADAVLERDKYELYHAQTAERRLEMAEENHKLSNELRTAYGQLDDLRTQMWAAKAHLLDLLVESGELDLEDDYGR